MNPTQPAGQNDSSAYPRTDGNINVLPSAPVVEPVSLARLDDRILDPAKRDEVLVFGKKTALILAAVLAVLSFVAEWHGKVSGYNWQTPEWVLILIIAPFGGLAASLAYLFQKATRGQH